MRWIATTTAAFVLVLLCPAAALAADSVFVDSAGVLRVWSDAGQVDHVTVRDGGTAYPGRLLVRDTSTPVSPSARCPTAGADGVACEGATVWSVHVVTYDGNDAIALQVARASWLDAGTGDDAVTAAGAADTVIGGDGHDTLDGGAGNDLVYGGAGNDRIEARDGVADSVDCGAGDDRVTADPVDTVSNCESDATLLGGADVPADAGDAPVVPSGDQPGVTEPKAGQGTKAGAEPAPDSAARPLIPLPLSVAEAIAVAERVVAVSRDGRASLELACAPTEVDGCRGHVYLDPAPRAAKRKAASMPTATIARRGRYGSGPFVIARGERGRTRIKLSTEARRALGLTAPRGKARSARRGRRVRARVTVAQEGRRAARSIVELRG